MKRFIKSLVLILSISLIGYFAVTNKLFDPKTVKAFGELIVDFHVPISDPIFTVSNMSPGQSENKNIDVTNSGAVSRMVSVKGIRTGGIGADPKIETALDLIIKDGLTPIYGTGSPTGSKTVANFFSESSNPNGVQLNIINSGNSKTYNFKVTFPDSAGNEFQNKSVIFDLTFGVITSDNLVINEVYYLVDSTHGLDSPKDRGILGVNGNNVTVLIAGNGANSKNTVVVNLKQVCKVNQVSNTNIVLNINSTANSGSNKANGNTGGNVTINSGNSSTNTNLNITGGVNAANLCGNKLGQDDEWVEIYNPTDHEISLKNWSLTDNSGTPRKINANKKIKAGGFALVSKDASTWQFWNEDPNALKVELGGVIGDGLDNGGDRLILKDPGNNIVDSLSWGSDTSIFTITNVLLGDSLERLSPGFDTNTAPDFADKNPPTPGF